jgi:hypothetical protein
MKTAYDCNKITILYEDHLSRHYCMQVFGPSAVERKWSNVYENGSCQSDILHCWRQVNEQLQACTPLFLVLYTTESRTRIHIIPRLTDSESIRDYYGSTIDLRS